MASGPYKFTFKRASLLAESECGSLAELAGILRDEGNALIKIFGSDMETIVQSVSSDDAQPETVTAEPAKKRGRPAKEATAPAPVAIPDAPAAPADMTPNAAGIPAALARDPATNTAPALAPPPAPHAAPAAPPTGVLAGKIIAEMDRRTVRATPEEHQKAQQAMADWLGTTQITVPGSTYPEACVVLRLQGDDKLGGIATQLGVAA